MEMNSVLVTGVSRGLGWHLVRAPGRQLVPARGAHHGRRAVAIAAITGMSRRCRAHGPRRHRAEPDCKRLRAWAEVNALDGLVNNAAIAIDQRIPASSRRTRWSAASAPTPWGR